MHILLMLFSIFCLFENTSLSSIGGVYTAPLVTLLQPFILVVLIHDIFKRKLSFVQIRIILFFILTVLFSFVLSIFYSVDLSLSFYLDRGVRLMLIAANVIIYLTFLLKYSEENLRKAYFYTGISVVVILGITIILPDFVNSQSFFQRNAALSPDRLRGFTLEASTFGFQLCVGLLMLASYYRLKLITWLPIIFFVLLVTTSKGALSSLFIALFIAMFIKTRDIKLKIFTIIICMLIGALVFNVFLLDKFASDIKNYSSVSTRSTMILTAILTAIKNPLGVGFFGYFDSIYSNGPIVIGFLNDVFPRIFNFSEVSLYFIRGTVESVSTKTFFFDWFIYLGFPFLIIYIKFVSFLVSKAKAIGFNELVMVLFIVLSISIYLPLDGRYIAIVPIAFLLKSSKAIYQS